MALTKTIEIDKIEIVTEYRHIQIRTATIIKEDNVELSRSFQRKVLHCGQLDSSDNLVDTDISSETTEVQTICNAVWTTSVKNAWKAKLISDKPS
tara:strand:+ start:222 stop:506 length:285 start_codon:yes stop_codon:yes gene_type:complete